MADLVALERKRRLRPLSAGDETKLERLMSDLERVLAALDHTPGAGDEGLAA
jgi:hypothetical protein